MKILLSFILLFGLIACGNQEDFVEENQGLDVEVGDVIALKDDDVFSDDEIDVLGSICSSLKKKESVFAANAVDKSVVFTFKVSRKECGSTTTVDGQPRLQLRTKGSVVKFDKVVDTGFYGFFADYETRSYGFFKAICDNYDAMEDGKDLVRFAQEESTIVYMKLFDSNIDYCSKSSGTKCALVQLIREESGEKHVVVEAQSLTIQTESGDYQGFVHQRKMQSKVFCENDFITMESEFVSN